MHTPVLLQQAIENLNVEPKGKYIDATFGEGGYSKEILKRGGKVLGIDLDATQLSSSGLTGGSRKLDSRFRGNDKESGNDKKKRNDIILVQGNFGDIEKIAKENEFYPVDGVVFDLGLSMRQIEESGRGFSYHHPEEPLDMRLSLDTNLTAKDLLKKLDRDELYNVLAKNSEEVKSMPIAEEIKRAKTIATVGDLIKAVDRAVGFSSKTVYARVFQALRIEVNDELNNLKSGLKGAVNVLKKGGRVVVVSFHSLEDRIVKNFVRENGLKFLQRKPIKGFRSFERSAKLRTIIK